jgi:membrane protein
MFSIRGILDTLVKSAEAWSADRAIRLGAGLAYYSLFALIPVLFLAGALAGILFGKEVASGALEDWLSTAIGPEIAAVVVQVVDGMGTESMLSSLPLISIGALLFAATLLFVAWKEIVNLIFGVPRQKGIRGQLHRRLFALAAVLGAGLLLSLVILAEALVGRLDRLLASGALDVLVAITGSLATTAIGVFFVAILFKYTPEPEIAWRAVIVSSITVMAMLSIGAWGYGIYLDVYGLSSASGVAGTLVLGLILVYYSAQILLYGVEITKEAQRRLDLQARTSDTT